MTKAIIGITSPLGIAVRASKSGKPNVLAPNFRT
jgi:hypothetical protein